MADIPDVQQDAINLFNELTDERFTAALHFTKEYAEDITAATIELTVDCSGSQISEATKIISKTYSEEKIIPEGGRLRVLIL